MKNIKNWTVGKNLKIQNSKNIKTCSVGEIYNFDNDEQQNFEMLTGWTIQNL